MTENLPIKLDKISKRLWPRRTYLKIKETHPILGSIFLGAWSVFWTTLAILLNIAFVIIIIATVLLILYALLDGSSTAPQHIDLNFYSSRKNEKEKR